MTNTTKSLSGWNCYPTQPCIITRPERYRELQAQPSLIARGQGRSYGDAALNEQGTVLLTERLNRILSFNKQTGALKAETGITLAELLTVTIPNGWFLPVTPGTQFTSLGGCIAADVHGKNHHHVGSLANFILSFELILADNSLITCSPSENANAFWATIGGMGLTGIIGAATIQLMPITNNKISVKQTATQNIEQTFNLLVEPAYDDEYTVAWLDGMATSSNLGRGIVMSAHHARHDELTDKPSLSVNSQKRTNIPFTCPGWLLNNFSIKLFNDIYYKHQARNNNAVVDYDKYFYPLDAISNWNKLYGKNGFVQYQCVIPEQDSLAGIKTILEKLTQAKCPIFLGVLKRFGASSKGLLSFPMPGHTLALDIPIKNQQLFTLLDELDAIVLQYSGRVYLAKDARLKPDIFRAMYPNYSQWLAQKQLLDPNHYFTSSLAKRLQLGY